MPLVPRVHQDRKLRSGRCEDDDRDTEHRLGLGKGPEKAGQNRDWRPATATDTIGAR
jgi:hypothetical protein